MKRLKAFALPGAVLLILLLVYPISPCLADTTPPEIHCKHFTHGYPLNSPATNDLVIRDLYALSSNDETKFADWVCYKLTPHETMGTLDLERGWHTDPWLAENETLEAGTKEKDDYFKANKESDYQRGHLAPLASFKGSRYASQVNFYSNITPQKSALNGGPWMRLEGAVRNLVVKYQEVWVMTGPLYEGDMPALSNAGEAHKVPSGFWKIIVIEDGEQTRAAAFIMGQDTDRKSKVSTHLVKIKDVEDRSGLKFLWELPDQEREGLINALPSAWVGGWVGD